jgi:hypothetical protein
MENEGIKIYTKTEEELKQEFEVNKGINKTLSSDEKLPENMIEYVEKLIIENIRSIKYAEKENIPEDIKNVRLQHLEKQQQLLLDRLDDLKAAE